MAYSDQAPGSRRIATIAGVAVIHGLLGFAFVTGMATNFVRDVSRTLTTTNVPVDVPPPPDTPPPPEQTATAPSSASTITAVVPRVPTPADSTVSVDLVPAPPLPFPPARIDVAPPPPPSPPMLSKASAVRALGNRGAWITTDDYPTAALRAEEQGVVSLTAQVGGDGRVTGCSVTASSGSATLDSAACRLYQRRARFEPARDDAGIAVATTYSDRVRWQLPR